MSNLFRDNLYQGSADPHDKVSELDQKVSWVTPEMFGAKGNGINDDTQAIRDALQYALQYKLDLGFGRSKTYKVYEASVITGGDKSYSKNGIFDIVSQSGLTIHGNNAKIYDTRARGGLGSTATGVFFLKGCSNITFNNLHYYMDPQALNYNDLQYRGGSFIYCYGDNDNIKVNATVENARYGVKSGNFNVHNIAEIADVNGVNGGLTNSKININAKNTGYPVAVEMSRNLDVEITFDQVHRAGYFCGTEDSRIRATGKTDYSTDTLLLLKDGRYYKNSTLVYKGCKNINAFVRDTGSTLNAEAPAGYFQLFNPVSYDNSLVPRASSAVTFENITLVGKIDAGSQAVGWWMSTDSAITAADVYRNITASIVDDSGIASQRLFRFVNLNAPNAKVENIRLKDVYTTKDIYFGSKVAATFELDNVNATNLYYDNATLAGANGAEKIYIKNSIFTNIALSSTSYNANASLMLEYVQANIALTHLDKFANFHIETRARRRGTTAQRPFINTNYLGKERCMVGVPFLYFDTTLNKMIMVSNSAQSWINLDGTVLA